MHTEQVFKQALNQLSSFQAAEQVLCIGCVAQKVAAVAG
jgi:hypothetical protein